MRRRTMNINKLPNAVAVVVIVVIIVVSLSFGRGMNV